MKSRDDKPRQLRAAIACLGLMMTANSFAGPQPPIAPSSSDGTYTVTLPACGSASCAAQWLEERTEPGGGWQAVVGQFVDKPPGTYSYRTADVSCNASYTSCSTVYSSTISVVVFDANAPLPEPLDAQLQYRYSVSAGNVVGDSGTDLLIERSSGPAQGNGVIDALVLQRVGSGFAAIVPSASQRNSSAWQAASTTVTVEDMNADGFVDLAVRNVAATIPGAQDQIVFASDNPSDAGAQGLRTFDGTLRDFTANLIDYMANERYFQDNATLQTYAITYSVPYCPDFGGYDGWGGAFPFCVPVSFTTFTTVADYSEFDEDAVEIWRDEAAVAAGELSRIDAAQRIAGRIEDVLGVDIGGWDMREIFGNGPGIGDAAERRGLEAFLAIIGIGNARADEVEPDEAQSQGPRANDVIHIVSRYVFGSSVNKMHTAVLYKLAGTGVPTWFSGFNSANSWINDGTLIAETNSPKDSPLLMRATLGKVVPPAQQPNVVYFFGAMQSAHEHYKSLPNANKAAYDAIPEFPCGGCNGRNSNGYVNGLIRATQGLASGRPGFDFNDLTGWEYPVEAHYFGR